MEKWRHCTLEGYKAFTTCSIRPPRSGSAWQPFSNRMSSDKHSRAQRNCFFFNRMSCQGHENVKPEESARYNTITQLLSPTFTDNRCFSWMNPDLRKLRFDCAACVRGNSQKATRRCITRKVQLHRVRWMATRGDNLHDLLFGCQFMVSWKEFKDNCRESREGWRRWLSYQKAPLAVKTFTLKRQNMILNVNNHHS